MSVMTSTQRTPTPRSRRREPDIVRASEIQDLLAAVPSIIGIRPEESVVVVPFLGTRAGGGFRLPLPERVRRAEVEALARGCARLMETMPRATAVLVVVYTSVGYAEERGIPQLQLGRAILRRLERTRLGIVAVACVAGDGWGRYTEPEECRQPRPLLEIQRSETGVLARAVVDEPLDLGALSALPAVDEADRVLVAQVLERAPLLGDTVAIVERWLTGPPDVRREGLIVRMLQCPPLRDGVTVQIASTAEMGAMQARSQDRLERLSAQTGESVSLLAEREFLAGSGDDHDHEMSVLLLGSGRAPERERLAQATRLLARAAALAPEGARSPVLTVLAWCWWARGVSSLAALHLAEALRLDPDNSMAQLYASLFATRALPDWVLDGAAEALDAASTCRGERLN
ncbi:hypothetical protein C5C28_03470 [Rathayibacter rathayi]|nr:hypothetical protein C5C28_03470 [Rathayibacter rathayi]PPI10602.1 hypothetical protein C5D23_05260 [Rathayibacter rathayi]